MFHPNDSSIRAVSDLLDYMNIENMVVNIRIEHLSEINYPAITYLNEKPIILVGLDDINIIYISIRPVS